MEKIVDRERIGEMDKGRGTYPEYNTNWGTYYIVPHVNGAIHYEFSEEEMKQQEEDLPFDDEHIVRILDDDSNIIWESSCEAEI